MTIDLSSLTYRRPAPMVVFFGAGAGVADGLPSTEQMARTIRDYVERERLHPTHLGYDSLRIFLARGDVASLMTLLSDVSSGSGHDPVARHLYLRLTWAAAKSAHLPEDGVDGLRKRLLERLYGLAAPLYVLTTNWDTSLDTIVQRLVTRDPRRPGLVDYGLPWNTRSAELACDTKPIHYFKLNGSPDWFLCATCHAFETADRVRAAHGYASDWSHLDFDAYCLRCGAAMERVMVLPSADRAYHPMAIEQHEIASGMAPGLARLLVLQSQALTAVMVAGGLLFVGYSLPEYDTAVRYVLKNALDGSILFAQGRVGITVVARHSAGEGTQARYESLLGAGRFRFYDHGLDGYLEDASAS